MLHTKRNVLISNGSNKVTYEIISARRDESCFWKRRKKLFIGYTVANKQGYIKKNAPMKLSRLR